MKSTVTNVVAFTTVVSGCPRPLGSTASRQTIHYGVGGST